MGTGQPQKGRTLAERLVSFAAAKFDNLGKVADSDQIIGLGEAVIGEAYPWFLIGCADETCG